jgi:2-keto-4-pentenoate hydratase/2-oxohepta-3-ene-1,7-dioic acid hydratase in catechol pathway
VKTDWEVELGVVIGEKAAYVSEADAMRYVCGYCICNDVSEREYQYEHGPTWDKGKGFDTFGPAGPWLVTKDEVRDVSNLNLWLDLDGRPMQRGNTKTMIFDIPRLIAYVSAHITLWPGDIISTGTPPGGGVAQKPQPLFLKAGQEVRCGIDGLGEQRQRTVASRAARGYRGI